MTRINVSIRVLWQKWEQLPVAFILFQIYNEFVVVLLLVLLSDPEKTTAALNVLRLVVENIDVPLTSEVRGVLFLLLFAVLLFLVFASVMRLLFAQSLRWMVQQRVGDVAIVEDQPNRR